MTGYGKRGGESPTAGRRAEVLVDPVSGLTKRTFQGQRFLLVQQDDRDAEPMVRAFPSREAAERVMRIDRLIGDPMVEYVVEARVQGIDPDAPLTAAEIVQRMGGTTAPKMEN